MFSYSVASAENAIDVMLTYDHGGIIGSRSSISQFHTQRDKTGGIDTQCINTTNPELVTVISLLT